MSVKILRDSGKILRDPDLHKILAGTAACPCMKTVTATIRFQVDDTEDAGCDFHADQTETLVDAELVDVCSASWGPFSFTYPAYDDGRIDLTTLALGHTSPPDAITATILDACGAFSVLGPPGCGSGYFCFNYGDAYYTGDTPPSIPLCTSGTITLSWDFNDGTGFRIRCTITITIA